MSSNPPHGHHGHQGQRGEFPDLRIVAQDDLLLHEEEDLERVARLIDRLSADGILKNPPIVASLTGSLRYMLLDGANRVSALRNLEVPHLLVQVARYDEPELVISHWNHVVRDIETKTIIEMANSMPGVTVKEGELGDRGDESSPDYLCTIALSESKALHLRGKLKLSERVGHLRELTQIYYRGPGRMDRVNHADFSSVRQHYPHFGALVLFPNFSKDDVRRVAEAGERLPSGGNADLGAASRTGLQPATRALEVAFAAARKTPLAPRGHQRESQREEGPVLSGADFRFRRLTQVRD